MNTISLGQVSTQTQFIVQIQPFTGTPGFLGSGFLNGETTTKSALGINTGNANDPLFQILNAGPFQATFQFQTWDGTPTGIGNGQDLLDYYNANNGGNPTTVFNTSVDFEFWWSVSKTTAKTVQVGTCLTNLPSFATIQTAVSAVASGATIDVCPGTYNEQVSISPPITVKGIASGSISLSFSRYHLCSNRAALHRSPGSRYTRRSSCWMQVPSLFRASQLMEATPAVPQAAP